MKKIILRADDLGISEGINAGILKSINNGLIRTVGLMVNMPASKEAADMVKDKDICLGLHANFSVEKPLTEAQKVPSLVDEDGNFKSSKVYRSKEKDFVNLDEAIIEIEAQLEEFKKLTGRDPNYIDAHAIESEKIYKALEIVANKHNLKYIELRFDSLPINFRDYILYDYMESSNPGYDPMKTFKSIKFHEDPNEIDVFIAHPGFLDSYIFEKSSLTFPRTQDLTFVCSKDLKDIVKKENIALLTYNDLN